MQVAKKEDGEKELDHLIDLLQIEDDLAALAVSTGQACLEE